MEGWADFPNQSQTSFSLGTSTNTSWGIGHTYAQGQLCLNRKGAHPLKSVLTRGADGSLHSEAFVPALLLLSRKGPEEAPFWRE